MNKDVIYIDVEDDITAIIGKIKASKEKIVALVPPKRVGLLQSAVNLRLLDRMASTTNKRLVLITNNQALIALSSAAGIPVAKNLQSKPEIAEISALEVDDGEDVIDGTQLPIGELEKTADKPLKRSLGQTATNAKSADSVDDSIDSIDIDNAVVPMAAASATLRRPTKSKSKVPNFDKFRKKLFIGIAAVVVLVGFLVWANVFAPGATITITARTTPQGVSSSIILGSATDVSKGTVAAITKTTKKDNTVQFTPTGQKDIGIQAVYKVTLSQLSQSSTDVPSGTNLTATNGLVFSTQSDVVIGAYNPNDHSCFPQFCPQSVTVSVIAKAPGTNYNNESGPLTGAPSGVSATFQSQTTDGTASNIVTVVSDADVQTATTQLASQSATAIETQLKTQFPGSDIVIDSSFNTANAAPVSSPAVGAQLPSGTTKATLTSSTTYTLTGVTKSDLESYLKEQLNKQLVGTNNQRIYDDGISTAKLTNYLNDGTNPATVAVTATGQIGPNIDETAIKKQSEGKIYGDVQSTLQGITGVENVDIHFSYFWVTKVPNDPNKITIEFKIHNG